MLGPVLCLCVCKDKDIGTVTADSAVSVGRARSSVMSVCVLGQGYRHSDS